MDTCPSVLLGWLACLYTLLYTVIMVLDQVEIVIGDIFVAQPRNTDSLVVVLLLNDSVPNDNFIVFLINGLQLQYYTALSVSYSTEM